MNKSEIKELYGVMFTDFPDIVTIQDMQKMLGISRHLAYNLINDGSVNGQMIGHTYKIPKISIINYVLSAGAA